LNLYSFIHKKFWIALPLADADACGETMFYVGVPFQAVVLRGK